MKDARDTVRGTRRGTGPYGTRRRRSGFTLAEVLVAIVFVSIGLFGYVSLQARLLHSNRKLQARQQPREQAQSTMEAWISQLSSNPQMTSSDANVGIYANEAGLNTLTRVRVQVTWDDENGKQRFLVESVVGKADSGW